MWFISGFGALLCLFVSVAAKKQDINHQTCTSDSHLLLAQGGTIWKTDLEGEKREALMNYNSSINHEYMYYDYVKKTIYWADLEAHQVLSYSINDGESKIVIPKQKNTWQPKSIAVDPISNKFYVAEQYSTTVQIFDSTGLLTIIRNGTTSLLKTFLDPYSGYLFMLGYDEIVRTDLDGENRLVIYSGITPSHEELWSKPGDDNFPGVGEEFFKYRVTRYDMSLDLKNKRIYWYNWRAQLMSSDYDGKDMRMHCKDCNVTPRSVIVESEYVYWIETEKVIRENVNNASDVRVLRLNMSDTSIIIGMNSNCQAHETISDPCEEAKCQELCIRSGDGGRKPRCVCHSFGSELAPDGLTCQPAREFLVYIQSGVIRTHILNNTTSSTGLADGFTTTQLYRDSLLAFDYNAKDNQLFYTSDYSQLYQLNLEWETKETDLRSDVLSNRADQFTYDWMTGNLYHSSFRDATILNVTNAKNPNYSTIIMKQTGEGGFIRTVVAHPRRGYLFYATLFDEIPATITRLAMDGSESMVIVKVDYVYQLTGPTLDYEEDRMYWIQARESDDFTWNVTVYHSKLDGSDIQEVPLSLPTHERFYGDPKSLVVSGKFLYILSGDHIAKVDKKTGVRIAILESTSSRFDNILNIFSRDFQANEGGGRRPCESFGCEKLCLLAPSSKGIEGESEAKCACPYGEKLNATDGKTCIDDAV